MVNSGGVNGGAGAGVKSLIEMIVRGDCSEYSLILYQVQMYHPIKHHKHCIGHLHWQHHSEIVLDKKTKVMENSVSFPKKAPFF